MSHTYLTRVSLVGGAQYNTARMDEAARHLLREPDPLLDLDEIAAAWGVTTKTLYNRGIPAQLPGVKLGRKTKYRLSDALDLFARAAEVTLGEPSDAA